MKHPFNFVDLAVSNIGGFLLFVSAMLAAINALCRYVLKFSLSFGDEVCIYSIIIAVFCIQSRLEWRGEQLSINVLDSFLNKSAIGKNLMFWIRAVATITVWCLMTRVGIGIIVRNYEIKSVTTFLQAPMWTIYTAYTLGMALILLAWVFLIQRKATGRAA